MSTYLLVLGHILMWFSPVILALIVTAIIERKEH